jgi:hypothetical protein
MSQTKSADATIRGFLFQFQETVIQLFDSDESLIVEGLDQDIEFQNVHIQCKYYKNWNNSELGDTIAPMYRHFLENKTKNLIYQLNLHVSGANRAKNIKKAEALKKILKLGGREFLLEEITDENLNNFLSKLTVHESLSIESNKELISKELAEAIGLKSGTFLYNAVIGKILEKSAKEKLESRSIEQGEFLGWLTTNTQTLAMEWLLARENESKYVKNATNIFITNIHTNSIIYIETKNTDVQLFSQLLEKILKRASNAPCTFPILCLGVDDKIIVQLKNNLYESGKKFYDEYPFLGCEPKYNNLVENSRNGKYKFISKNNLTDMILEVRRSFSIINFYETGFENFTNQQTNQQVNIPINSFNQLLNII